MNPIKDYLLIQRIKAGDDAAWEILVDQYYDNIYSYCLRCCYGNQALAADLAQDTFLKLIENIHRYRFTGKFYNYLFTIAINTCRNYFNKKQLNQLSLEEYDRELTVTDRPFRSLEQEAENHRLQSALDSLSKEQKEAILLKFYHHFKVKDIAKVTGVSTATAQSRIQQGIKKMAKELKREELDYFE